MRWFYNAKIGYKLALVFGFCLAVLLTVGGMVIQRFSNMDTVADMITREVMPGTVAMSQIGMDTRTLRIREIRYITVDAKRQQATLVDMQREIGSIDSLLTNYQHNVIQPADRANIQLLQAQWADYKRLHAALVVTESKGDPEVCFKLYNGEMKTVFKDQIVVTVDKMFAWNIRRGVQAVGAVKKSNAAVRGQIVLLLGLGALFSGLAAVLMTRLLMRTLAQLATAADGLARGDAQQRIDLRSRDETGQVAESFRALIAYQQEMAGVAEAIAGGDLTQNVVAKSEKDVLGHTFNRMIANLRQLVATITAKSDALQASSDALQESEERHRSVVEHVKEVIFTTDRAGHWTFLNPAWTAITGYRVKRSLGQMLLQAVVEEDRPHIMALCTTLLQREKDYCRHEMRFRTKAHGICWVEAQIQSTLDAQGRVTGLFGTLNDITERKEAEAKLQHLALHDALTGLPNRLLFQDRLRGALGRIQRHHAGVAVLFMDLDNFKYINDSMGHEAGDTLLKTIAAVLQSATRNVDTVARLGGDEFTLLLEEVHSIDAATVVADRIFAQLQLPIALGERQVFASASIGIAFSADSTTPPDELMRDADMAMYQAKTNGKSGYALFDASMYASLVERMEIETGLRFALERGELQVYYQPLIDLETGLMSGAEALIRWEHPIHGLMLPGKFIPIAEETGLILPIGYWVLEVACRQRQAWKAAYPDLASFTINVNLSGKQLMQEDVVERVRNIVEKTGICPQELKLEITESVMIADVQDTVAKLTQMKALGIQLAMDDFGTGYSSMASLSLFPLDTVKIDRSFVAQMDESEQARSLVAAIVMLSKSLNLNITGEGVETEAHVIFLQGLGCHTGQGYYFGRPAAAEALDAAMATRQHPRFKSLTVSNRQLIQKLLDAA